MREKRCSRETDVLSVGRDHAAVGNLADCEALQNFPSPEVAMTASESLELGDEVSPAGLRCVGVNA